MPNSTPTTAQPLADTPASASGRRSLGRRGELLLALLPTATVLLMLWLLELLSNQRLLFASLASSAFLIYLDPGHRTNSARTLAISQLGAASIGFVLHALVGPGYVSAALAMVLSILLMIALDAMHPPAVSTGLNFAFRAGSGEGNLLLFGLAVGLVVVLVIVQRGSTYILSRLTRTTTPTTS
ncbi:MULTISPECIES: HPP family protein [Hymenobacter]|uniref:HPP family protein n=1 Tax=Hymenobacter mucosus TaxID=1411120 RepID=A0A238XJN7_9BACT|nr:MULTISPECIES: HPP family protein [Hymenobacter]SNR59206.1 HPP family protein [Hymenobacter mucosus]